tara:strand:+ start:76 stop:234 length:159 start_codon:yes stop_codon:yes gene_type:complete
VEGVVAFLNLIFGFSNEFEYYIRKKYRPNRGEFNEDLNHLGLAQFYFQNLIK